MKNAAASTTIATSEMLGDAFLETVIDGEAKTFLLGRNVICHIGRDKHNDLVIAEKEVSRHHAMVECAPPGGYYLIDLGSRNGTLLNGRHVTAPVPLHSDDRITIGSREIVFQTRIRLHQTSGWAGGETAAEIVRRTITVLVADVRDFTALCRRNGEVRISNMISTFFRQCGAAAGEHGAWSQKYIGDAVMAIWLHRTIVPDLPEMFAVFSALAREFEVAASLDSQFALDAPIRIGAGVNTGPACVGNLGSDLSSDYTAMSDAVNLSFRLESATRQIGCDVAVGSSTYDALAEQVAVDGLFETHTVSLKGYQEAVRIYAATSASIAALVERVHVRLGQSQHA